jgi:hypothetical protein
MLTAHFGASIELLAKQAGVSAVFSKDNVAPVLYRARALFEHR